MKLRPARLLAAFTPILFSLPGFAQLLPPSADEPSFGIDEVVIVQGWRHPVQLRLQMVEAELAVYELFNQLTADNSLRLDCSTRSIGGTRLLGTDCMPRYESQALAQEGQDQLEATRSFLNSMALTTGNFSTVFPGAQNQTAAAGNDNAAPFSNYMATPTAQPAVLQIRAGQNRLKREMDRIATENPEFVAAVQNYVEAKTRYTQALRRVQ